MLNSITIMGRMTRDPELRRTNSGTSVTSFTLAVDDDYKNDNGERKTIFVECVAWRGTADFVSKYFGKGRMAIVKGKLDIRDWTDKEGNKRKSAEVVAENVYFGDSKKEDSGSYGGYSAPAYQQPGSDFTQLDDDEQLPF